MGVMGISSEMVGIVIPVTAASRMGTTVSYMGSELFGMGKENKKTFK